MWTFVDNVFLNNDVVPEDKGFNVVISELDNDYENFTEIVSNDLDNLLYLLNLENSCPRTYLKTANFQHKAGSVLRLSHTFWKLHLNILHGVCTVAVF